MSSHTFFFSPDLVTYKWKTEQRLSKQLQFFFFSFSPTTSLVQRLFDIFIISQLLFFFLFFLNSRHYHNKLVALMSLLSSSSSFFITPLHCLVFLRCGKKFSYTTNLTVLFILAEKGGVDDSQQFVTTSSLNIIFSLFLSNISAMGTESEQPTKYTPTHTILSFLIILLLFLHFSFSYWSLFIFTFLFIIWWTNPPMIRLSF